MKAHVTLIPENVSETANVEAMRSVKALADLKGGGNNSSFVGIHYHPWLSGEAVTAPHVRRPPFRQEHCRKALHSAMKCRMPAGSYGPEFTPSEAGPGDMYILVDGKPIGIYNKLDTMAAATADHSLCCDGCDVLALPVQSVGCSHILNYEYYPVFYYCPGGHSTKGLVNAFKKEGGGKKPPTCNVQPYFIALNEQGLRLRKRCVRNSRSLRQMYQMYCCTKDSLELPEKSRVLHLGTNYGNVLGPVMLDKLDDGWLMKASDKKTLYGPHRVPVGGPTKDSDADSGSEEECTRVVGDNDIDPVFHNYLPVSFYRELIHSFCLVGVYDQTPGPGCFAFAAIQAGIPYCGLCFTERHAELLYARLTDQVLAAFMEESHPLYNAGYVASLAFKTKKNEEEEEPEVGGPEGTKAKVKGKPKATPKKTKTTKAKAAKPKPKTVASKLADNDENESESADDDEEAEDLADDDPDAELSM